jgi:hypothetical protein
MIGIAELTTEQLEALLKERKEKEAKERMERRNAYEQLREDTIAHLINQAVKLEDQLSKFKADAFGSMDALYELLKEYSNRHAEEDAKGNFTIENAAETLRIRYSVQELGNFDERSQQAERHIINFVTRQFADNEATKELIMKLLERKKGKLDIKLVQKLYSLEDKFQDESWKEGIRLLKESYQHHETKRYINFYVKDDVGAWQNITLKFSAA